jgi:hypothetical protein
MLCSVVEVVNYEMTGCHHILVDSILQPTSYFNCKFSTVEGDCNEQVIFFFFLSLIASLSNGNVWYGFTNRTSFDGGS